ncbi:type VII secretion protein EssB/YukC [Bacillus sp. FSL K6-3431]|uniref:type VII secretion protein EssB/YukC n=1 Tax=Bacillus sp. FSL K6-3431 TaxID=2921500 RepID=UPI0030F80AD9
MVELQAAFTNVQEEEQLSELTKVDSLFLTCKKQEVKEETINLFFHLPEGYKPLKSWVKASLKTKQSIAKKILNINNIQGTQFTTYIHPDNIYCNSAGDVKFVHRGIRSLLPPEQEDGKEFIFQIKCLIISLFTGESFFELLKKRLTDIPIQQPFVKELGKAKSLMEIRDILSSDKLETTAVNKPNAAMKVKPENKKNTSLHSGVTQSKYKQEDHKVNKMDSAISKLNKNWMYALGILMIGLLIGGLVSYVAQVKPQASALTSSNKEKKELANQLEKAVKTNNNQGGILAGYKLIFAGEHEKAIQVFSAVENLSMEEQKVLAKQYVELNTPESLEKASSLDSELHSTIAAKLVGLNSKEANAILMSLKSDSPSVQIEQAWLKEEYERVISIANEQLKEDNKAKVLAVKSYLKLEKTKEAEALAKQVGDIPLQIAAKNQEIDKIKKDTKKSKKNKDEEIEKIKKEIKKLNESKPS